MAPQAATVWLMASSMVCRSTWGLENHWRKGSWLLPTCSSTRRISGWKRTMRATAPHSTMWARMKFSARSRPEDSHSAAITTSTPLMSREVLVFRTSSSRRYTRYAITRISSTSHSCSVKAKLLSRWMIFANTSITSMASLQ